MDSVNRNKIVRNIDFLAENTSNIPVLLNKLREKRILTEIEIQTINSKSTAYEKNSHMYSTVVKKGDAALKVLLYCLESSGNKRTAEEIAALSYSSSHTSNYDYNGQHDLIWFDVTPPTKFYKGRQEDISKIEKCWLESFEPKSKFLMVVGITGLGGVGKTELAKNYAKIFHEEIQGHCIWINGETSQTIYDSFQRLANELEVSLQDESGNQKSTKHLALNVFNTVRNTKCLFIFDNVETNKEHALESLYEFAMNLPPTEIRPFVLLTSRFKLVSHYFGDFKTDIELNVLSKDSSIELFVQSLNIDTTHVEAVSNVEAVCERLQNFPLAMQQAIAFIKAMKTKDSMEVKIKIYLNTFDEESKRLLAYPLPSFKDDGTKTTYLVWEITLEKIERIPGVGSKARNLMNLMSLLHSDDIDIQFVRKLELKHPTANFFLSEGVDIFEILDDYSMCQRNEVAEKVTISIHRLVQEVIRVRMEEKGTLTEILDKCLEIISEMFSNKKVVLSEAVHIKSLWRHAAKNKELVQKHKQLPGQIIRIYYDSGRDIEAFNFATRAVEELKSTLGLEDRCTLRMISWKGGLYEDLHEYESALLILRNVYETQKRVLGEEDEDTLDTAGMIGTVYMKQNNFEEAIKWMKYCLHKCETKYGNEHSDTLISKHNLAMALLEQGMKRDALQMFKEVLMTETRLFGEEAISTMTTKLNIAKVKLRQSELEESLTINKEVLEVSERVLGPDHLHTLLTKYSIAIVYSKMGLNDEALKLATQVYRKRKVIYGDRHPHTVNSKCLVDELKLRI